MNILKYINFSALLIFPPCIDPVIIDFNFKEDLIIINPIATNVPGATNIIVENITIFIILRETECKMVMFF